MAGLDEMRQYAHSELYGCIRNRAGIEFTAEQTITEAVQDGVTILEMSIDVTSVQNLAYQRIVIRLLRSSSRWSVLNPAFSSPSTCTETNMLSNPRPIWTFSGAQSAAATSQRVMTLIKDRDIRLNVCPSSNVVLSVAKDLRHHPIRILVRNGIRVTVNSDDKTIFGKTVTDEYLALHQEGTLNAEELEAIRVASLSG